MFPRTSGTADIKIDVSSHTETVVLLTHRNVKADSYVDVSLDMDEYRKMTNKG